MITLRVHSIDGHDNGTLIATPDGDLRARPNGKRGEMTLARLAQSLPEGESAAAYLHHLARSMPGRAVIERDDWQPQPHGHDSLTLTWDGEPEATLALDGDRLRIAPHPGIDERDVRETLARLRQPHWSDADLYHALPDLLRGRLKAVPGVAQPIRHAAPALNPGPGAARPWGSIPGDAHVGGPGVQPHRPAGSLIRVVGGTGKINHPAHPSPRPGQQLRFLHPPEITAAAMSAALQAQHGYQMSHNDRAQGIPSSATWGASSGNRYPHQVGAIADAYGNAWTRENWGGEGVSSHHPRSVGEALWESNRWGADRRPRHERIPATDPHFRFETHPELRAFFDAMIHGGPGPSESWQPHFEHHRGMLADWLDEGGHPAAEDVRKARFADDVMSAIARHESEAHHTDGKNYYAREGEQARYAAPPTPLPESLGSLGAESRVAAHGHPSGMPGYTPSVPPAPLAGPLIRSSKGPLSMPPLPLGAGNISEQRMPPGHLHNKALAAGVSAMLNPHSEPESAVRAMEYASRWRRPGEHPFGHMPNFEHAALYATPDGSVHVRPVHGPQAMRHAEIIGQAFPGYDATGETEFTPALEPEPTTQVHLHDDPHFRGMLAQMRGFGDHRQYHPAPYQMLQDWLEERQHPAAPQIAKAKNLHDVVAALSDWQHDGQPQQYSRPVRHNLVPPQPAHAARAAVQGLLHFHQHADHGVLPGVMDALDESGYRLPSHDHRALHAYADPQTRAGMSSSEHRHARGLLRHLTGQSLRHAEALSGKPGLGHHIGRALEYLEDANSAENPTEHYRRLLAHMQQHRLAPEHHPELRQVIAANGNPWDTPFQGMLNAQIADSLQGEYPRAIQEFLAGSQQYARDGSPERHRLEGLGGTGGNRNNWKAPHQEFVQEPLVKVHRPDETHPLANHLRPADDLARDALASGRHQAKYIHHAGGRVVGGHPGAMLIADPFGRVTAHPHPEPVVGPPTKAPFDWHLQTMSGVTEGSKHSPQDPARWTDLRNRHLDAIRNGNVFLEHTIHPDIANLYRQSLRGDMESYQLLRRRLADMGHPGHEEMPQDFVPKPYRLQEFLEEDPYNPPQHDEEFGRHWQKPGRPERHESEHAPAGGADVGGKHYPGGEFVPGGGSGGGGESAVLAPRGRKKLTAKEHKRRQKVEKAKAVLSRAGSLGVQGAAKAWGTVEHVEHVAKEWVTDRVDKRVNQLPEGVQGVVRGVWQAIRLGSKALFATYTAGQSLAEEVAIAKGATPEQAARLRGILQAVDVTVAKPLVIAAEAAHLGEIGWAMGLVPVASTGYLAYSLAKDPVAVMQAARATVRKAMGRKPPEQHAMSDARRAVESLLAGMDQAADADLFAALVCAALDDGLDLAAAVELARQESDNGPVIRESRRVQYSLPAGGSQPTQSETVPSSEELNEKGRMRPLGARSGINDSMWVNMTDGRKFLAKHAVYHGKPSPADHDTEMAANSILRQSGFPGIPPMGEMTHKGKRWLVQGLVPGEDEYAVAQRIHRFSDMANSDAIESKMNHPKTREEIARLVRSVPSHRLGEVGLADWLVGGDRHSGNYLYGEGLLNPIDYGYSVHPRPSTDPHFEQSFFNVNQYGPFLAGRFNLQEFGSMPVPRESIRKVVEAEPGIMATISQLLPYYPESGQFGKESVMRHWAGKMDWLKHLLASGKDIRLGDLAQQGSWYQAPFRPKGKKA